MNIKMLHRQVVTILILVTMEFWAHGAAQSEDCTNVLISMSPCLGYKISGNSSGPSAACCTQLSTVAHSQPNCLCQVVNGGGPNLGLNIDKAQSLALPKACNIQTPPPSQCKAASPSGPPKANSGPGCGSNTVPLLGLCFLIFAASFNFFPSFNNI